MNPCKHSANSDYSLFDRLVLAGVESTVAQGLSEHLPDFTWKHPPDAIGFIGGYFYHAALVVVPSTQFVRYSPFWLRIRSRSAYHSTYLIPENFVLLAWAETAADVE